MYISSVESSDSVLAIVRTEIANLEKKLTVEAEALKYSHESRTLISSPVPF